MKPKIPPPPDFSNWTTNRLKFLLEEYQLDLSSCRALFGKHHQDCHGFENWVTAIEAELAKRNV